MASYKYKLENILGYRQNIEDKKRNELGLAFNRLSEEKNRLQNQMLALEGVNKELEQQSREGMDIINLKQMIDGIGYYKRSIKRQRLEVKMAHEYVENCRVELVKATQERKAMEKMKEKDYIRFLYSEQKKDEKMIDELVSFKQSSK